MSCYLLSTPLGETDPGLVVDRDVPTNPRSRGIHFETDKQLHDRLWNDATPSADSQRSPLTADTKDSQRSPLTELIDWFRGHHDTKRNLDGQGNNASSMLVQC